MRYILHGCNDASRLRRGLAEPAVAGVEIDFYIEHGVVHVSHDPGGEHPIGEMSMQTLGDLLHGTRKILVADIKPVNKISTFSTDEARSILKSLNLLLPVEISFFVVGFATDWISVVARTIKHWNGREVTYFVAAPTLAHCQATFRQPGIRFGLNPGHQTSVFKKFLTESLPAMLEKDDMTSALGKGIAAVSRPFKALESYAWNCADVKMAWTVDSDATLQEIQKLNPDYIIVAEYPLTR